MEYFEERIAEGRKRQRRLLVALVLLAFTVTAALFFFLRGRSIEELAPLLAPDAFPIPSETGPPLVAPTALPTPPPIAEVTLDELVRKLVAGISSHPSLAKWLATDGLVRRFVVAVDNIALGESPRGGLLVLDPGDDFAARRRGGRTFVDPASYRRYGTLVAAVDSIDVDGAARAFVELEPRLDQAYRELGYPDRRFRDAFRRAIDRLVRVPVPAGEIELRPALRSHRFADPALEARSDAEKHLLRLGPENMRKVQAKLAELARALDLPHA